MKERKKKYRFGFLGIGKMGQAILRGILREGLAKPSEILASRQDASALKSLAGELRIDTTTDNRFLARSCDWIWLGVKPFHAEAVLREIAPHINKKATLLSVLAGISTRTLRFHLGRGPTLIRLMPNTPALLGAGMTGIYFPKGTPLRSKREAEKILGALGAIQQVARESELDAVTGLSGSGPAFVYLVAQGLIQGGIQSGLKPQDARTLAYQTLLGATRMLQESGRSPEELISQVVTKGGTTEAGLKVLATRKAAAALAQAVQAAAQRAAEIKEQNESCTR